MVDDVAARAAAAAVATAVCRSHSAAAVAPQQRVDRAHAARQAVARRWDSRTSRERRHGEARDVQVVGHLTTDSHGEVQQVRTAEYLQRQHSN